MQQRSEKEKNTVEQLNDKDKQIKGLVLNTSYDFFCLGEDISKYEKLAHHKNHYDNPIIYDDYEIDNHGFNIELWCEDGHIVDICCRESCIYDGMELIKMDFDFFLKLIKEKPLNHEIIYVPCKNNWGQNQHVYDFDKSGLQVWVWRGKIRTIIIFDTNADEK